MIRTSLLANLQTDLLFVDGSRDLFYYADKVRKWIIIRKAEQIGDFLATHPEWRSLECQELTVLERISDQSSPLETLYWKDEIYQTAQKIVRTDLGSVAVFFHLGNHRLWDYFYPYLLLLKNFINPDFYVSYQIDSPVLAQLRERFPGVVLVKTLRGLDIGGQLHLMASAIQSGKNYDFALKLHTKTDLPWRHYSITSLCGTAWQITQAIIRLRDPAIGMLCPEKYRGLIAQHNYNSPLIDEICLRLGLQFSPKDQYFAMGTMFWFKWSTMVDFADQIDLIGEAESMQLGYITNSVPSIVHSWERIFGVIVHNACQRVDAIALTANDPIVDPEGYFNSCCLTPSDINEHLSTLRRYGGLHRSVAYIGPVETAAAMAFMLSGIKQLTVIHPIANVNPITVIAKRLGVEYTFIQADNLRIDLNSDIVFIDGWHIYGQVKRELARHQINAKCIILHDTTVDAEIGESVRCKMDIGKQVKESGYLIGEIMRGIWPAVAEFLTEHPEWKLEKRLTNNNGLTILIRK